MRVARRTRRHTHDESFKQATATPSVVEMRTADRRAWFGLAGGFDRRLRAVERTVGSGLEAVQPRMEVSDTTGPTSAMGLAGLAVAGGESVHSIDKSCAPGQNDFSGTRQLTPSVRRTACWRRAAHAGCRVHAPPVRPSSTQTPRPNPRDGPKPANRRKTVTWPCADLVGQWADLVGRASPRAVSASLRRAGSPEPRSCA
jgi:hypothetical protein